MVRMKQNNGQDLLWVPVFNLCYNIVYAQLMVLLFHTVLVLSKDKSIVRAVSSPKITPVPFQKREDYGVLCCVYSKPLKDSVRQWLSRFSFSTKGLRGFVCSSSCFSFGMYYLCFKKLN